MVNKTQRQTLKNALLSGMSIIAFTAMIGIDHAGAAALTPTSGANTATGADTIDAAAQAGATDADLTFDQSGAGATTVSVTVTGAGTTNLRAISVAGDDDAGDTADLVIGDGNANTVVILNGAVTGDAQNNTGGGTTHDLDITIDAADGAAAAGNSSLSIFGNTDAATGVTMQGDANGTATLTIGDGTNAANYAGTIDMSNLAGTVSVLNVAAASTVSGAIDLSSANGATSTTINLGAGSTLSGAISDTADATLFTLNVDGNATASAAIDAATTTSANIEIDDGVTLTATGTGAITVDSIDLDGGTLRLDGAKTITGAIDGNDAVEGTLDVNAATTLVSAVGATNALASIDIAAVTLTAQTNVKATAINFSGDGTLQTTTGTPVIESAITSTTDNTGTLDLDVATTITGTVGSSTAALKSIDAAAGYSVSGDVYSRLISGAGAADFNGDVTAATSITTGAGGMTFAGDVTAGAINMAGGALTFDGGTTAQTITGAIDGASTLTVTNSAGATFASAVGDAVQLTEVAIASGQSATFQSTVDAATVDVDGTIQLDVDGNTATTLEIQDGSTVTLGAGVAAGETVFTGTLALDSGDDNDAEITLVMPASFNTGTITLVSAGGAAGLTDEFSLTDTALVSYSIGSTAGDINITATGKSTATTASELGVTTQEALALSSASTAVATGDTEASTALNTALTGGGAGAKLAAEQVGVQADTLGAGSTVAIATGGRAIGVASKRLAALRSGKQYASADQTGFSSGDTGMAKAAWIKPFGNWAEQDARDGVAGFTARTYGLAVGLDTELAQGFTLGGSFAYANSDVDGKGAGDSQVDINSYQVTVYGDYTTDAFYIEGMLGYAHNSNDGKRKFTFGGLDRQANSDYNSSQYMASIGGGVPVQIKGNAYITFEAGLDYTHVNTDSYTETGAGNLNLNVDSDNIDALIASLGARVHTRMKQGEGVLIPEFNAGVSYDLSGDEAVATATYTGGGAAFKTTGADVEELAGNVGFGMTYDTGAWSVGARYDAEFKSEYISHSALVEARFKF
ncbi:autotransporter outer membrane beta-barrel domain-containing protein [Sneathiella aquimaris]|uniref:autotransporter outer membrane beta-barrel domain-containing protein n=1 Tax=Sneathiella aquimaris TaxID=2599305 RepID=UPI00146EE81F|nr:autotransporter domain-containing protein [Sneathiella aquimaris]